jgi:predicted metal-dependent phosphotriesterase family hydrolase
MTVAPATAGPHELHTVRTVLGDIPMERLGRCDYHEHPFKFLRCWSVTKSTTNRQHPGSRIVGTGWYRRVHRMY